MTKPSNRTLAFRSLKDISKKARNGAYFVKRGAVEWEIFPFPTFPLAISIQVSERTVGQEINKLDCAMEFGAPIPGKDEHPGIDDELMDRFDEDYEAIIAAWRKAADEAGNFVLAFAFGRAEEFHDADYRVQGVTYHFTISI